MSREIRLAYPTGSNLYAVATTAVGTFVAGTTPEAFTAAHWGTYAVAMAELSSGAGQYAADFPALVAGAYSVDVYLRAGGSPALSDALVASGGLQWTGTAEATLQAVRLDLAQPLADVKTATVGGALHGGWAVAFGKQILDRTNKLLKMFGFNSQSVPLITHDLDSGSAPTTRTPE